MQINWQSIKEYTQTLTVLFNPELILLELLRVIDTYMGLRNAGAYLAECNNFKLKAKIGSPEKLFKIENHSFSEMLTHLKNLLQASGDRACYFDDSAAGMRVCLVPLGCDKDVPGFLVLDFIAERSYDQDLLTILANQAFIALKSSLAEEQKEHLDNAAMILNSSLDINTAYPLFVSELQKVIGFDRLTITVPDMFAEDRLLIYAQFYEEHEQMQELPITGTAYALVFNTGHYVLEEDLARSRLFIEDEMMYSTGIRTALRLPLISKGKVIAALNIGSKKPSFYGPREIKMMTGLCHRISSYIENALVYSIVNNKLQKAVTDIQESHAATLQALTIILDSRDAGTKGHCQRVTGLTTNLAGKLGLTGQELEDIRLGALLHDIGKIGIPDSILFKAGRLEPQEMEVMRGHPLIGYDIVASIDFLKGAVPVVLHHHERFDGQGYPYGLQGHEIPLGARIFSIVDAFDAMTSDRPYRAALPRETAMAEIRACSGKQFCPECVEMFMAVEE